MVKSFDLIAILHTRWIFSEQLFKQYGDPTDVGFGLGVSHAKNYLR
jgi:hypothetical protein